MVTIIQTTPEQMRLMNILKGNNKKLSTKKNREEAIKLNEALIKGAKKAIVATAREA